MEKRTQREFDIIVLGATGFTGRLAVERLALLSGRGDLDSVRWAVAGRDIDRLESILREPRSGAVPAGTGVVQVDVEDEDSVRSLARRSRVVVNFVGPYTSTAQRVIAACVDAGTHYADLSGELPLLRRVIDRYDEPAGRAGACIVQLAGWEALAPDVTALQAARAAVGPEPGVWGPGAAAPVREMTIISTMQPPPTTTGAGPTSNLSAGTVRSIAAILADADASSVVGDPAGLLPRSTNTAAQVRRRSPLRLTPWTHEGSLVGPQIPVAFLNPPAIHRTAALLAEQSGNVHRPARVREGSVLGPTDAFSTWAATPAAFVAAGAQRAAILLAHLPLALRRRASAVAAHLLPPPGTGPDNQDHWTWSVRAEAVTTDGDRGTAVLMAAVRIDLVEEILRTQPLEQVRREQRLHVLAVLGPPDPSADRSRG